MEQVILDLAIPVNADNEGKQAGELCGDLLAAFVDAGDDSNHAKDGDEPKETLFVAQFLQVKTGRIAENQVRPRQKETDAQTKGAQVDQLCSAQTDGLIFGRRTGGGGFRFRFDGNLVGHSNSLWLMVYSEQLFCTKNGLKGRRGGKTSHGLAVKKISVNRENLRIQARKAIPRVITRLQM
jgi:hypothetical protein